jgi:hypothetical protein
MLGVTPLCIEVLSAHRNRRRKRIPTYYNNGESSTIRTSDWGDAVSHPPMSICLRRTRTSPRSLTPAAASRAPAVQIPSSKFLKDLLFYEDYFSKEEKKYQSQAEKSSSFFLWNCSYVVNPHCCHQRRLESPCVDSAIQNRALKANPKLKLELLEVDFLCLFLMVKIRHACFITAHSYCPPFVRLELYFPSSKIHFERE